MKQNVDQGEIGQELAALLKGNSNSPQLYASLLRRLLTPSRYQLDDESISAIVMALRKCEQNPSHQQIVSKLLEIASR